MPDGLIAHVGVRGGSTLARWGLRMLGAWAARKWWPTARLRDALPLRATVFTVNDARPHITFNLVACSFRFALEQSNDSPYHVDWLGAAIEVAVEGRMVAAFEIGPRGRVKARGVLAFRVEHAMTACEMSRLRLSVESAKTEKREGAPETKLFIHRLFRTTYDDHYDADNTPVVLDVPADLLGEEPT